MKTEIQIKIEAIESELSRFIASEIANGAKVEKTTNGAFIGEAFFINNGTPADYDATICLHVKAPEIADAVAPARESLEDEKKRLEDRLKQIDNELQKGGSK
jgi:hypothetical protein